MADVTASGPAPGPAAAPRPPWMIRLVASPRFQKWAARFPLTRGRVRREGAQMFDLVAGFCHAQVLQAFVRFDIPGMLLEAELPSHVIAGRCRVPAERMQVLLQAAAAMELIRFKRGGRVGLTTRGAALAGVPGLQGMIKHHDVLYRDLSDPVAFFRGEVDTELAHFWPYVFGAAGAADPTVAETYSELMSDSQGLVAQDTLAAVSLKGVAHLMDVGGGTGAFLGAIATDYPELRMTLFDLPAVVPGATARFDALGASDRVSIVPGSFRDDPFPTGADMISLVRVLYDHADETVAALLASVYEVLPPGGRVLVSEPMAGGGRPERAGDAYFALYCMAMRTGKARSAAQIGGLLQDAGFENVRSPAANRPFVTSVITAVKPS